MDIQYLLLLQNFREATGGFFNGVFLFLTELGWSVLPFLIVAVVYWCLEKKAGELSLLNIGIGGFVNGMVKLTACVYRPWIRSSEVKPIESAMALSTGYSFPSGHMTNATALYGGIAVKEKKNRMLRNSMIILILLVGFSRNYIGVHTPQDVLVSAGIGILLLWITNSVLKWVDAKEGRDLIFVLVLIALSIAGLIYISMKSYPMDYLDGKLIVDPEKMKPDSFGNTGMMLGTAIGWLLERRFVKFSTEVSRKTAVSRFISGALGVLLLYYCATPFFALFLPSFAAKAVSGGIQSLYLILLHPMVFTAWEKKHQPLK